MLNRRAFVGSTGLVVLSGFVAWPARAMSPGSFDDLNWSCDVIESVSHGPDLRTPVVTDVALQPGGDRLAVVGDDHFVCIYDLTEKRFIEHLGEHRDWVRACRFSPDGRMMATAGNDRRVLIWDTANWAQTPRTLSHPNAVFDVAFTRDSRRLATVGFDDRLRIYDLASSTVVGEYRCDSSDMHAVAFSSDDRIVVAGGRSGVIQGWDIETGVQSLNASAHRRRIRSLIINDADRVITCGDDQKVVITDLRDPSRQRTLPRHAAKLYAVAALPGNLLATGGSDNLVHIWRLTDNQHLGALRGHTGTVACLDYDETRIVSGSYDTQIRIWHIKQDFIASLRGANPERRQNGILR